MILIPTHFLFSGELSHLIGLGLSFFYLEHLLKSLNDPERVSIARLAVLGSLTLISSFTAYAPIALISSVITIGINRRILWKKLVLANIAPIVTFAWYVIARTSVGEVSLHAWELGATQGCSWEI